MKQQVTSTYRRWGQAIQLHLFSVSHAKLKLNTVNIANTEIALSHGKLVFFKK